MGEATIKDLAWENVANINFQPNTVCVLDVTNSTALKQAVKLPAAALDIPLGVVKDKAKLDPTGAVAPQQQVNVRTWGKVTCLVAGAVNVNDRVSIANASGQVQTQTRAIAGAQPAAIVGIACTPATAVGQSIEVMLAIGSTW